MYPQTCVYYHTTQTPTIQSLSCQRGSTAGGTLIKIVLKEPVALGKNWGAKISFVHLSTDEPFTAYTEAVAGRHTSGGVQELWCKAPAWASPFDKEEEGSFGAAVGKKKTTKKFGGGGGGEQGGGMAAHGDAAGEHQWSGLSGHGDAHR